MTRLLKIWSTLPPESLLACPWTHAPLSPTLARHGERGKKTRQTEEEVGRQHLGMDSPGVRQVPEGNGEQGK